MKYLLIYQLTDEGRHALRTCYVGSPSLGELCKEYIGCGWWRCTVVERRSVTGELSLSHARPAVDG